MILVYICEFNDDVMRNVKACMCVAIVFLLPVCMVAVMIIYNIIMVDFYLWHTTGSMIADMIW
jgi:hypothetical protein